MVDRWDQGGAHGEREKGWATGGIRPKVNRNAPKQREFGPKEFSRFLIVFIF